MHLCPGELLRGHQPAEEAEVRGQTENDGGVKGVDHFLAGQLAVGAVGDELGQHRVVVRAYLLAYLQGRINPYRRGPANSARPPSLGQEIMPGVLRVHAHLYGVPLG